MARLHSILALSCAIALPIALSLALGGCVGALIVGGLGAAAGGGYVVAQERGVTGAVDDVALKADIERELTNQDPQLQAGITTTVFGGRVLLTGRVANPEMKAAAEQIAGRTRDVRALYDEIEVAQAAGVWDDANDAWITTRVRSEMVVDLDVRSLNYTIDTANGSVYLIGSARSQAELDRATQIARYVPGVKRVVSYVEIRSGVPVAAMPAPPPAAANSGPRRPSAAPQSTIQVQKL